MKLNPKLKLRKIGKKYMVVDAETGSAKMTNVFTFINSNTNALSSWCFKWNRLTSSEKMHS